MADAFDVVEVSADETHAVRMAVLRADTATKQVIYPEDTMPGTFHLGVLALDGRVVATSTWVIRPLPITPQRMSVQLRLMATMPEVRGQGTGAALIRAGRERARDIGAELVWANARDSALGFYRRVGFEVIGDGFVDTATQLPHHIVIVDPA